LIRVLIPYVFWSLVILFLAHRYQPLDILGALLTGTACVPYYFIIVIVQFYQLLPALWWLQRREGDRAFLAIAAAITLLSVGAEYAFVTLGVHRSAGLFASPFCVWLIYFCAGMVLGRSRGKRSRRAGMLLVGLTLLLLMLSIFESFLLPVALAGSQLKVGSICYGLSLCVMMSSLPVQKVPAWLVIGWLSSCAFGIYLIHIPVLEVLWRAGMLRQRFPMNLLVSYSLCLLVSCGVIWVSRKLLPARVSRGLLGFG
jgi:peptidoglycan/LPS O-acetylase OafA/YrhL